MRRAVAVLLVLALPACTTGVKRKASPSPTPARTSAAPTVTPSDSSCPAAYAEPKAARPDIRLTFDVDDALAVVTGTETVSFTPDRPVTEWVFRLWPNSPGSAANGASMTVTRASLPMTLEAGRTLLRLRLPSPSPAGTRIQADLQFRFVLPRSDFDRYGHSKGLAWWATGHPLLAWVDGRGWVTDPPSGILGETAVSEVASYDVSVDAPAGDTVVGNGASQPPGGGGNGRRRWHFVNDRARDVAVAVGRFTTRTETIGGVPVTVAVEPGLDARTTVEPVLANLRTALADYTRRYGPYPFDSLNVVALAAVKSGGIEYPGLFFVGSRRYDVVVPHELAHEWFYGLVGDDQATDPWLDEAFATYNEALVNHDEERYLGALSAPGDVGKPMAYWDTHEKAYSTVVYGKGAAALLTARDEAGAAKWDEALRCYVRRVAYRVATPADLVAALRGLPTALAVLRDAGAVTR